MDYQEINAATIDQWIEEGWEWGIPVSHEVYMRALEGDWSVLLTPNRTVPKEWFGCTVLDYSKKQLASERMVAQREGYEIEIIRADMTKGLPFEDESFDIIFHPVSNCYVEEVKPIFKECYRILKDGGLLLSGLDNGMNFIFSEDEKTLENTLPFNPLKNKEQMRQLENEDCGVQFSHTLEEQIGGQLEAGFILTHLMEDTNECGNLKEHNIPSFIATRAVKKDAYKRELTEKNN